MNARAALVAGSGVQEQSRSRASRTPVARRALQWRVAHARTDRHRNGRQPRPPRFVPDQIVVCERSKGRRGSCHFTDPCSSVGPNKGFRRGPPDFVRQMFGLRAVSTTSPNEARNVKVAGASPLAGLASDCFIVKRALRHYENCLPKVTEVWAKSSKILSKYSKMDRVFGSSLRHRHTNKLVVLGHVCPARPIKMK